MFLFIYLFIYLFCRHRHLFLWIGEYLHLEAHLTFSITKVLIRKCFMIVANSVIYVLLKKVIIIIFSIIEIFAMSLLLTSIYFSWLLYKTMFHSMSHKQSASNIPPTHKLYQNKEYVYLVNLIQKNLEKGVKLFNTFIICIMNCLKV